MELSLHIFAVLGFSAGLWRALRAALDAVRRGVEAYIAREVARTRAHRGDVTGMEESAGEAAAARRGWRRSLTGAALWIALLALPAALLSAPAPVYAVYTVLWLLPRTASARSTAPVENRS